MSRDSVRDPHAGVVDAARAGAPWALERLWVELAPGVRGYLAAQGCPEPDDVASDVFLAVFRALPGFTGGWPALRSWVFTIAHARMIDDRRRRTVRTVIPVAEVGELDRPPVGDVADEAIAGLATERVRAWCGRLDPDQRDVLLMRLVAGLTVDEVATAIGRSAGAVKQLQRRGLLALRAILAREGVTL